MSFIYLDEELPEIELREVITGDEYLEDRADLKDRKRGLNIYTGEEIYNQLLLLLQSLQGEGDLTIPLIRKAETFQKLHQEVITTKRDPLPARSIIPEVYLQRKDNGDEDQFYEDYAQAMKIENYETRRKELHRTFLGLETTREEGLTLPADGLLQPTEVILYDSQNDRTVVLPEDTLLATIKAFHVYRGGISPFDSSAFQPLTLLDKIQSKKPNKVQVRVPEEGKTLAENTLAITEEKVEEVVGSLSSIGDLYQLWKDFMEQGVVLETAEQLKLVEAKLRELQEKDREAMQFFQSVPSYRPKRLDLQDNYGGFAFYVVMRSVFEKLQPILEKLKEDLLNLYQGYLDSYGIQPTENANVPLTAYEIALALSEEKVTLEDVLETMKLRLLKQQRTEVEKWLRQIQHWKVDGMEEKVTREYNRFSKTQASFQDEPLHPWLSVHEAIREIKKGEVLAKDREEAGTMDKAMAFLPEFVVESEDPDEIELPVYEDGLPVEIEKQSEGNQELLGITLRMFQALQRASGLPIDYEQLLAVIPDSLRKTRRVLFREQLPDISEEVLEILAQTQMEYLDTVVESIADIPLVLRVKSVARTIYMDFIKDLTTQWTFMLAWWVCTLQNHVLHRTLLFEIWAGALNCIQSWSPYGFPMEEGKKKEGILPYLLCIIYDLSHTEGTLWNQWAGAGVAGVAGNAEERLEELFATAFQEEVASLRERFKTFEKELPGKGFIKKGEEIKKQITETVEQRQKNRYLVDYMKFLKNLPSVLIQSTIAKKIHLGCCLQLLSDRYRADYDWSGYVKNAYKLKKLFATQRIGFDRRPYLSQVLRAPPEVVPPSLVSNKEYIKGADIPDRPLWSLQANWEEALAPLLPLKEYKILTANLQQLAPITEKNLDTYQRSFKLSPIKDFVLQFADCQALTECFRKTVQLQKRAMEELYGSKPKEQAYLRAEMEKLYPLFDLILSSSSATYTNEYQDLLRKRVLQYLLSRQLCFPAKPELAKNNTLVLLDNNLEASLLTDFLPVVYESLKTWVLQKRFNSSVNFTDYISKMREQENITKLKIVDVMNPEERKMYVQAKKLGIQELEEYMEIYRRRAEEEKQNREAVDAVEEEGEDEFFPTRGENDDEADMDKLYDDEPRNHYAY